MPSPLQPLASHQQETMYISTHRPWSFQDAGSLAPKFLDRSADFLSLCSLVWEMGVY